MTEDAMNLVSPQERGGMAACRLHKSIVDVEKFRIVFRIGYLLTIAVGCQALAERVRNGEGGEAGRVLFSIYKTLLV